VSADYDRSLVTSALKRLLLRFPALYGVVRKAKHRVDLRERARQRLAVVTSERHEILKWRQSGRPVPPPDAYKQMTVTSYGRTFGLTTLVETGTYVGDMVEAQRVRFRRVLSIELSPELCHAARARFARACNVTILVGDSEELIESVVKRLAGPAVFWLDGHYSAGNTARGRLDTPIRRELEVVLTGAHDHVVLVDDARCFGTGDYPTLDDIRALVAKHRPGWGCVVKDDIIRIWPTDVRPRTRRKRGRFLRRWLIFRQL
jgi:hypothetical protein